MEKRLLTVVLTLMLGLGIWTSAVVDFGNVAASFADGEIVSAAAFNELFGVVQSNFLAAKEAIEANQSDVAAWLSFRSNLVAEGCPLGSAMRAVAANGAVTCQLLGSTSTAFTAGDGLVLAGDEFSLDTDFADARYLTTEGGGVVDGNLTVNAPTFVGVNRSNRISTFEAFGIRTNYGDGAWGGMYIETASATGRPFYGYSVAGGQNAWTEYHGQSGEWRLYNAGFKIIVQPEVDTYIATNLTLAGILTENSDRDAKHAVQAVDTAEILAKLDTLPISTWRFDHDPDVTHMGPMAQDFYATFGLGHGERTISAVDRDGVALAAIQALHDLVRARDTEIAALEARLATIEGLLATAEVQPAGE
jgi:hypothetical protein